MAVVDSVIGPGFPGNHAINISYDAIKAGPLEIMRHHSMTDTGPGSGRMFFTIKDKP